MIPYLIKFLKNTFEFNTSDCSIYSISIRSQDDDMDDDPYYKSARLTIFFGKRYFGMKLPTWVCPPDRWTRVRDYPVDRAGELIEEVTERCYGISLLDNHLAITYGSNPFNGSLYNETPKRQYWSCFLPWAEWRFVRHSLYTPEHTFFADLTNKYTESSFNLQKECPSVNIKFLDFDGEENVAHCFIEEREWQLGEGYFKWLRFFVKPKINRIIDITYDKEVGSRKGSWKGGTIGCSAAIEPGESIIDAFKQHALENNLQVVTDNLH